MKRLEQWFLLFALLTVLLARTAQAEDPMKVGRAALDRKDYLKAIEAFRDASQNDKKNAEAFYLLGVAYFQADSLDQAVGALVQDRELEPAAPRVYELLGDVYMKQHITAGAVDQYRKATELDSTNAALVLKYAETNKKLRKWSDAANGFLKVIALDSNNVSALSQLGSIYVRGGLFTNALPVYIRLEKLQPDSLNVLSTFVVVLSKNGYYKDIPPAAEKVLEKDPSNETVSAILAEALVKLGRSQEALDKYRAMKVEKMKIEELVLFARALKMVASYDSAAIMYQTVLKRDSTRCDIPYELGTVLMKLKKYEDAIGMFNRKIACDTLVGYRFASHLNAAMCEMQLKQFDDAKVHILKSIELRPDNIQAVQTLAQCNLLLGNTDEGIASYRKVIDMIGDDTEGKYANTLEEAYRTIGVQVLIQATKTKDEDAAKRLYQSAFDNLKKSLALNPKNCEALLWAAQAAQNSNNKEEARRYYCKVLKNCPKAKEAAGAQKGLETLNMKCED